MISIKKFVNERLVMVNELLNKNIEGAKLAQATVTEITEEFITSIIVDESMIKKSKLLLKAATSHLEIGIALIDTLMLEFDEIDGYLKRKEVLTTDYDSAKARIFIKIEQLQSAISGAQLAIKVAQAAVITKQAYQGTSLKDNVDTIFQNVVTELNNKVNTLNDYDGDGLKDYTAPNRTFEEALKEHLYGGVDKQSNQKTTFH